MESKIVGTEFAKSEANGMSNGSKLMISHDSGNEFDKNALAVYLEKERIGYIGKNSEIYEIGRDKFPMTAEVVDFYIKKDSDEKFKRHEVGQLVSCTLKISKVKNDWVSMPSFNEDGISVDFNEKEHIYRYGKSKLTGATTYIKKYIEDFDDSFMIERCSKAWGIEAKTIKKAWNLGGELASTFGTGIHKALEFEDLYRNYRKPKDDSRCFKINHPMIQIIVQDFFDFYDSLGFKGEVKPEALITDVENGMCALADRVLVTSWENKTCRLQDYKVNHSFDQNGKVKFKNLPKGISLPTNKISKLSLQLKVQSTMLEKQGWTIEGVDGFVFDGKWNYYEANTLDGFDIINGTFN